MLRNSDSNVKEKKSVPKYYGQFSLGNVMMGFRQCDRAALLKSRPTRWPELLGTIASYPTGGLCDGTLIGRIRVADTKQEGAMAFTKQEQKKLHDVFQKLRAELRHNQDVSRSPYDNSLGCGNCGDTGPFHRMLYRLELETGIRFKNGTKKKAFESVL
jgi:hypothetical protein